MRPLLASLSAFALIASFGLASAQDKVVSPGPQPPAKQSAPSESADAPGHDAQSGKPATGESTKGPSLGRDDKADRNQREPQPTTGDASTGRR